MLLPLLAYLAPLYNPPRANLMGLVTPLVLMGVVFCLFRQQRHANPDAGGANPGGVNPGCVQGLDPV